MKKIYFITGTDTDIGKTYVTVSLLNYYNQLNRKTLGLKLIASGCESSSAGIRNKDAVLLQDHATLKLSYEQINPYAFIEPIAPHIAAEKNQVKMTVSDLKMHCEKIFSEDFDVCLIEGVGGWFVPINENETMADFVKALNIPIIFVVGMRLGCINHALLTQFAMKQNDINQIGWIANCIDPTMLNLTDNLTTLTKLLATPLLGVIPFNGQFTCGINLKHQQNYLWPE